MMEHVLHRWAWLAFALFALGTGLWVTRYEPATVGSFHGAWDRWGHRYCLLIPEHGWLCGSAPR